MGSTQVVYCELFDKQLQINKVLKSQIVSLERDYILSIFLRQKVNKVNVKWIKNQENPPALRSGGGGLGRETPPHKK